MALPFSMFEGLSDGELGGAIADLCRKEHIELIVIGFPLFSDGRPSAQSQITERFIVTLGQCTTVPIRRISEHLTSHDSEGKLAGHFTRLQKRQRVDALAAAAILQDWFDQQPKTGG